MPRQSHLPSQLVFIKRSTLPTMFLTAFVSILLLFSMPSLLLALSDSDYNKFMRQSPAFAAAEERIKVAWGDAGKVLSAAEFAYLQKNQRKWLKSDRDDHATWLSKDKKIPLLDAYVKITEERAKLIEDYLQPERRRPKTVIGDLDRGGTLIPYNISTGDNDTPYLAIDNIDKAGWAILNAACDFGDECLVTGVLDIYGNEFITITSAKLVKKDVNGAIATAKNFLQKRQAEKAKMLLEQVITTPGINDEEKATVYMLLASCVDGTPAALTYSAKAVELDPKNSAAYMKYATELLQREEYGAAITNFTKLLEITPKNAEALTFRGLAYRKLKNYDKAINDFTAAINLDKNKGVFYFHRAMAYNAKGIEEQENKANYSFDKALEDFRKAIELKVPDNLSGACYYYSAKIVHARKSYKNAQIQYKVAISHHLEKEQLEDANAMLQELERIIIQEETINKWK